MENLPHSRQPNIFSKKTCNGSSTKSIYDDVFGGPPRSGAPTLAPRVEDYCEIFGGFHSSRASSIPVLDLPLIGDEPAECLFDVRGSGFDYSEVFGGFDGHDFAVSYEEMVMMMMEQSNGRADSSDDDEAWTPAEVDSLSEELDHSMKDRCFSNRDSHESVDDSVEFNISYNQYGGRISEDSSNGAVHVTQHHDVSGRTCSVDKSNSLPKADYEYWSLQESNEDDLNITYSGDMLKERHLGKVMSHPANGVTDGLDFGNDIRTHREYVRNNSLPSETFVTISDVSLRTRPSHLPPPSRPPPALEEKKGDSGKTSPTFEAIASEEIGGESSPPYFDVEIDASSSAGVSAAAMKEAMQKAQAKLKSAKEFMERKREDCSRTILGTKTDGKVKEEKMSKHGYGSRKDGRGQVICERKKNGMEFCVSEENQNIRNTSQLMLDTMEGKTHPKVAILSAEESRGRESFSSQGSGEWKEATEFFELVTDKSRKCFGQDNVENILISNSNFSEHEKRAKKANLEALQRLQENGKKVKAVRADHQLEETIFEVSKEAFKRDKFSGRSEAANKQKVEMKVQVAQETSRQERNEKKFEMDWQHAENEMKQTSADGFLKHDICLEVQQFETTSSVKKTIKHKEKGSRPKEDDKSNGDVNKFTCEMEVSEGRQRKAFGPEENAQNLDLSLKETTIDKRLKKAPEQDEKEKLMKAIHKQEENKKLQREECENEDDEKRFKEVLREENEWRLKGTTEKEENGRRLKETREKEERLIRQRECVEEEENETKEAKVRLREENEGRQRETRVREEREKILKEAFEKEETLKRERDKNEMRQNEALEKENRQRSHREAIEHEENMMREREQNEKRLKGAHENKENERRLKAACEKEENERRLKMAFDKEENEKRQKEAREREENEKKHETEIRCKEVSEKEEIELQIKKASGNKLGERLEEICEQRENCSTSRGIHEVNGSDTAGKEDHNPEKIKESSQTECKWEEMQKLYDDVGESGKEDELNKIGADHSEFNQAHNLTEDKNHQATQLQGKHERNIEKEEATDEKLTELKKFRNEAAPGIVQPNNFEQERSQLQMEDVTSTEKKTNEKVKSSVQVDSDIGNQGKKFGNERNERKKTIEQTQVPLYQDNNKGDFMPARAVRESLETGRKIEAAQPTILEVKGSSSRIGQQPLYQDNNRDDFMSSRPMRESVETGRKTEAAQPTILEVKGSSSRIGLQVNASQSTERKLKNGASSSEDKEAERLKREREQEKEHLRRMEEEWEREREREKDRMAVDRATLETSERASAEARERAERAAVEKATSEARQRALNEARERLEKACAEAREKTLPDKVSVEARLRAERAAVERATAEARERAFEKAMAERATFEARERIERSISDKFSTSTGTGGTKPGSSTSDQQDLLSKGASSFSGSRYQYSFCNERFEEVEGESAQRCKARLERHRRTAERAAKALAEKNMRDHLAQREQAEISRLAETLDADVKRWSNGKEGNLRALLSTLQYILGPDSGWQPIPLTEVITPTAAKKAYRKATLCVHPDKLQQRGATIQQKYICEKVFDLLKEAWNKFNSEER